jgi:hypothetical protein
MQAQPDDTQAGTGREVVVPALGHAETDERQDEVGDLVAKEKTGKALFIFEVGLTQTEGAFEISEHFFNPETLLVPGDGLLGIREGCAELPDAISQPGDDDVDRDRFLVPVLDVGEDDGRAFNGVVLAQRASSATIVHEGFRAEADDEGKALFLKPADEFGATKAGIGQEQGGGIFG